MRRMFAHQLFLKMSGAEFERITGSQMLLTRSWISIARLVAPWFLVASFAMLLLAFGLWGILFLPIFVLGYFLFSLRSMRDGGPLLPSVIVIGSFILLGQNEAPIWVSRFLATFGMALWCNRFGWWFAEWSLNRNAKLTQLLKQKLGSEESANQPDMSNTQEAEVIEIT